MNLVQNVLPQYTEADLYKQLAYFCHIFDTVRCIDKVKKTPQLAQSLVVLLQSILIFLLILCCLIKLCYELQIEANLRIPVEKELARIRPLVELAASTVQKIRDRCAYGWVQLNDLAVSI